MSRFQPVPFNITGGTFKSKAQTNNNTSTVNFFPEVDQEGIDSFILQPFPGQKHLVTTDDALTENLHDRGMTIMAETIYRVNDTKLIKVTKDLIQTEIPDLPINGLERCIFANDGINLVIVNDLFEVFIYNSISDTLVAATDPNLTEGDIISVSFLNNQFMYTSSRFIKVSTVGLPDSIDGRNIIGAESNPDDIVLGYTYEQLLYVFGVRTIETFWNSGRGKPPIERIEGRLFSIGLASKHSVAHTDKFIYFLGDDQKIYRSKGGQHQEISNKSIVRQIQELDKIDDASAFTFSFNGFNFYAITFPESKKTFCLNEEYGLDGWFELNSGDYNEDFFVETTYNVGSFVEVFNKRIMCDLDNGKLFELDLDTYENDSKPILRERVTNTIDSSLLGVKGKLCQVKRIEIIAEKGVGLISGQGEDPKLIVDVSLDGGNSWKHVSFVRIGRFGESFIKCEAFLMDKFYNMQIRLRTSDPVYFSLHSAIVDLRIAGR